MAPSWIFCWPPARFTASSTTLSPPATVPPGIEVVAVALVAGAAPSPTIRELVRSCRRRGVFSLVDVAHAFEHRREMTDAGARGDVERTVAADLVTVAEATLNALYGPAASVDMHSIAQLWLGLGARLVVVSLTAGGVAIFHPTAGSGEYLLRCTPV